MEKGEQRATGAVASSVTCQDPFLCFMSMDAVPVLCDASKTVAVTAKSCQPNM